MYLLASLTLNGWTTLVLLRRCGLGRCAAWCGGTLMIVLPFVHWLPRHWWYGVLRWTGNAHWASESMLNPLSKRDLEGLFAAGVNVRIERQRELGGGRIPQRMIPP